MMRIEIDWFYFSVRWTVDIHLVHLVKLLVIHSYFIFLVPTLSVTSHQAKS